MVTDLFRSITTDVLAAVGGADFFDASEKDRNVVIEKALPAYPKAITMYLATCDGAQFMADLQSLIPVLGSSSVVGQAQTLVTEKNGYFVACVDALKEIQQYTSDKTQLGAFVASVKAAGAHYEQVFVRECQALLFSVRKEDSAVVQIAAEMEIDTSNLQGIPSVQVSRSLLGGARIFQDGKLKDESWRARLTRVLSVI